MTRRTLFVTAVMCAIFSFAAMAADISGNWTGNMQMADQAFPLSYSFKVAGDKLTGTVTGPQGDAMQIKEGKITGDKVSFYVDVDMGGQMAKFVSEGVIKGEEITLTTKMEGGDFGGSMTLKRAS
ncbi:MAG: hypothetical protein ABI759_19395 [Candidatus Solibacter sp.]